MAFHSGNYLASPPASSSADIRSLPRLPSPNKPLRRTRHPPKPSGDLPALRVAEVLPQVLRGGARRYSAADDPPFSSTDGITAPPSTPRPPTASCISCDHCVPEHAAMTFDEAVQVRAVKLPKVGQRGASKRLQGKQSSDQPRVSPAPGDSAPMLLTRAVKTLATLSIETKQARQQTERFKRRRGGPPGLQGRKVGTRTTVSSAGIRVLLPRTVATAPAPVAASPKATAGEAVIERRRSDAQSHGVSPNGDAAAVGTSTNGAGVVPPSQGAARLDDKDKDNGEQHAVQDAMAGIPPILRQRPRTAQQDRELREWCQQTCEQLSATPLTVAGLIEYERMISKVKGEAKVSPLWSDVGAKSEWLERVISALNAAVARARALRADVNARIATLARGASRELFGVLEFIERSQTLGSTLLDATPDFVVATAEHARKALESAAKAQEAVARISADASLLTPKAIPWVAGKRGALDSLVGTELPALCTIWTAAGEFAVARERWLRRPGVGFGLTVDTIAEIDAVTTDIRARVAGVALPTTNRSLAATKEGLLGAVDTFGDLGSLLAALCASGTVIRKDQLEALGLESAKTVADALERYKTGMLSRESVSAAIGNTSVCQGEPILPDEAETPLAARTDEGSDSPGVDNSTLGDVGVLGGREGRVHGPENDTPGAEVVHTSTENDQESDEIEGTGGNEIEGTGGNEIEGTVGNEIEGTGGNEIEGTVGNEIEGTDGNEVEGCNRLNGSAADRGAGSETLKSASAQSAPAVENSRDSDEVEAHVSAGDTEADTDGLGSFALESDAAD